MARERPPGCDPSYKRDLKVELVDVVLGKNSRGTKQDLAAVDDLEFTELAAFDFGIARFEFSIDYCPHYIS